MNPTSSVIPLSSNVNSVRAHSAPPPDHEQIQSEEYNEESVYSDDLTDSIPHSDSRQAPSGSRWCLSSCVDSVVKYKNYAGLATSYFSGLTWTGSGIGMLTYVSSSMPEALPYVFGVSTVTVVGGSVLHALAPPGGMGGNRGQDFWAAVKFGYGALPLTVLYGCYKAHVAASNCLRSSIELM